MEIWDPKYNIMILEDVDYILHEKISNIIKKLIKEEDSELGFVADKSLRYAEVTTEKSGAYNAFVFSRLGFDVTLLSTNKKVIKSIHNTLSFLLKLCDKLTGTFNIIKYDLDYDINISTYITLGKPVIITANRNNFPEYFTIEKLTDKWVALYCNSKINDIKIDMQNIPIIEVKLPFITENLEFINYRLQLASILSNNVNPRDHHELLDQWYAVNKIFPHNIFLNSKDFYDSKKYNNMYCGSASLLHIDDGYLMALTLCNYVIPSDEKLEFITKNKEKVIHAIALFHFDKEWRVTKEYLLQDSKKDNNKYVVGGITDARLIDHNRMLVVSRMENDNSAPQMVLVNFNKNLISNKFVQNNLQEVEKNWLPYLDNQQLHIIYDWSPLTIIKHDGEKILQLQKYDFARAWRGSAPPIKHRHNAKNGYLCMIHEVYNENNQYRRYYQRWVFIDESITYISFSDPWKFTEAAVEFCLSILNDHDDDSNIICAYSKRDNESYLCNIEISDINHSMWHERNLHKI
jgi:hypothetical protein